MATSLSEKYLDIPTPEGRRQALDALVRVVSFRDRLFLLSLISTLGDPVSSLPPEISLYIFDFLPVYDVWRLRAVCRSWQRFLSSSVTMRAALARRDTHHPSDSALTATECAQESVEGASKRVEAARRALPHTYSHIDASLAVSGNVLLTQRLRSLDLKRRSIAYLQGMRSGADTVVVRDLVGGDTLLLRGAAREKILCLVLAEDLIAFATYTGLLYTAELRPWSAPARGEGLPSSPETSSFRNDYEVSNLRVKSLPSSSIISITVNISWIAILLTGITSRHCTVCIYDQQTDKLRSLQFEQQLWHQFLGIALEARTLLIDPTEEHIDVFSDADIRHHYQGDESGNEFPLAVGHMRLTLTGQKVTESATVLVARSSGIARLAFDDVPTIGEVRPTGNPGEYAISFAYHWRQEIHHVMFDARLEHKLSLASPPDFQDENLVTWKDMAYSLNTGNGMFRLNAYRRNDPPEAQPVSRIVSLPPPENYGSQHSHMLVNDTFLAVFDRTYSAIHVFCFDESVCMHDSRRLMRYTERPFLFPDLPHVVIPSSGRHLTK